MKRKAIVVTATILFGLAAALVWQHAVYRRVTDPACGISFGDYLSIRWLMAVNPEGEYLTDRFVLAIRRGWPDGVNVRTGRQVDENTGEGAIYTLRQTNDSWYVASTGFWSDINGRPRHARKLNAIGHDQNGMPNQPSHGTRRDARP